MTEFQFQVTAASLAIILEVFSEEAEKANSQPHATSEQIDHFRVMQTRVGSGEFWGRLGGLAYLEQQLRAGFAKEFANVKRYSDAGQKASVEFPEKVIEELFFNLRGCDGAVATVGDAARAALPYLRAFADSKFAP